MADQRPDNTGSKMKGGTKDFNWDDVRYMSYKDRESYLGYTVKIGFLDKGGRWKKRDWWKGNKGKRNQEEIIQSELEKEKEMDEKRMRIALGLEEKEEEFELPKMTGEEARYVTHKMKKEAEDEYIDEQMEQIPGLGFKLNANLGKNQKVFKDDQRALRLEGYGIEEIEKEKERKDKTISKLQEKSLKEKKGREEEENEAEEIHSKKIKKKKKKKDKKKKKKEAKKLKKKRKELERMYRI